MRSKESLEDENSYHINWPGLKFLLCRLGRGLVPKVMIAQGSYESYGDLLKGTFVEKWKWSTIMKKKMDKMDLWKQKCIPLTCSMSYEEWNLHLLNAQKYYQCNGQDHCWHATTNVRYDT